MKSSITEKMNEGIEQALAWVAETQRQVPRLALEAQTLAFNLRRGRTKFNQLAAATDKKPTLGFYGRAQAAKISLITALAAAEPDYLAATFSGNTLDFLNHIHPNNLPAGIALRFRSGVRQPQGEYPVQLTLLTEAELVKMIARACPAVQPVEQQQIAEELQALATLCQLQPVAGLSEDEVVAIWDALRRDETPLQQALPPEFWPTAVTLAPYLGINERARLFSPLWGNHELLTDYYRRLAYRLQQLGSTHCVTAPLSVIIDKDRHPTYGILGIPPPDHWDEPLYVIAQGKKPVAIPLADLRWLTAELLIPLSTPPPHRGLAQTDFLDLPSYCAQNEHLPFPFGALLSAKSLCLLERYSEQQEVRSLILCNAAATREEATIISRGLDFWRQQMRGKSTGRSPGLIWAFTRHDQRSTTHYDQAVQRYVGQPGQIWGTMLVRNDEEIQRMADYLAADLNSPAHQQHLAQQLVLLEQTLWEDWLGRWHGEEPDNKAQLAKSTVKALQPRIALHGELLEQLLPNRQLLRQLYLRPTQRIADPLAVALNLFGELPDLLEDDQHLTDAVQMLWINQLRALADNVSLLEVLAIPSWVLATLADELITASFRLGIWQQLAEVLAETAHTNHRWQNPSERQITAVRAVLGDFVTWLGFQSVAPALRPASRINPGYPIFTPSHHPATSRLTQLPSKPVNNSAIYLYDWLVGLHALICHNVGYGVAQELNAAQRERLGEVIRDMQPEKDGYIGPLPPIISRY
ncbi:hypothetical protein Z042_24710 [Chania multitudinisentens RB-25]|uniref:Virulence factor n=1 Tax=Chania multitudinisentens RB-25 TaxID=1441930 RepID=W0LKS0_9GAMM|nr:virulence factor SrfC family protein [Chania multitudinisentens]AHG23024.1 hypothetical protein Z042_24710 [Chania multitudinisentens RB-25]